MSSSSLEAFKLDGERSSCKVLYSTTRDLFYIMGSDENTKCITFIFDNDQNKSIKINMKDGFEKYVEATKLDYYIDTSNNELVRVPGASQSMPNLRNPTKGMFLQDGIIYRPAIQSEIDYNEKLKYDNDNHNVKLYNYMEKKYNELYNNI